MHEFSLQVHNISALCHTDLGWKCKQTSTGSTQAADLRVFVDCNHDAATNNSVDLDLTSLTAVSSVGIQNNTI